MVGGAYNIGPGGSTWHLVDKYMSDREGCDSKNESSALLMNLREAHVRVSCRNRDEPEDENHTRHWLVCNRANNLIAHVNTGYCDPSQTTST